MSGSVVCAIVTIAGLLLTPAPYAHGRSHALAAAEERSLWGWPHDGAAGSGPFSPPQGAGGAPGPNPPPGDAEEVPAPSEPDGSGSGVPTGPPSPPPPDSPDPSAGPAWHGSWSFAPNALAFWRAGYLGWMFTPVGFVWADFQAEGGIMGFCGRLLVGNRWHEVATLIMMIAGAVALYRAGTACQALTEAFALLRC